MATTRIIPMHINKGKTIAQCMKARIDYVKNPDKTEDGEFISSYACAPESADHEFLMARDEYLSRIGSGRKNEVIAYQLRQSFKPGSLGYAYKNNSVLVPSDYLGFWQLCRWIAFTGYSNTACGRNQ